MIGNIIYISNDEAHAIINDKRLLSTNLINMHVVFLTENNKILGEIIEVNNDIIKIRFLGEFRDNNLINGITKKPTFSSTLRIINGEELSLIIGSKTSSSLYLGTSPLYNNYPVSVSINDMFSSHLAVLGNSGSGKSYSVARMLQNLFNDKTIIPKKANIILFDTYGEYKNALSNINKLNNNYNFKYYSTSLSSNDNTLKIPIFLLDEDDLCLLLGVTSPTQRPIIERTLKYVKIFSTDKDEKEEYKNYIIASSIQNILYTNETSISKKNDIFNILSLCSTKSFKLNTVVQGLGYTRELSDCFIVDSKGNFVESNLLSEYLSSFIKNFNEEKINKDLEYFYTLQDLENALNFTLISEGLLNNKNISEASFYLKIRLHSLLTSEYSRYFDIKEYISLNDYLNSINLIDDNHAQIVNINLSDIDDWFGKFITKTILKMLFESSKQNNKPYNIFIEEAHRYVTQDNDKDIIGYNIFERIAKEGRKYGIILTLISQRPVELSDTVISQISNFLIFKITHPKDAEYIKAMLPLISNEIVEKVKSLQPGTCVGFGKAFKIPEMIKFDMPSPLPGSENNNIIGNWVDNDNIEIL
ncbi:MAG: DUF87 domain-containing protein [Bacilli bacterium]